ncbi:chromate transporter [Tenuibacillus multivorans]|uniref:Chromate transporter n=1 Tax=Tenuibacillus multivorans TaxID=237069 RepID=A0A1H0C1I3_9BACI|nr:chromate transporter [Tenuibacillus multivorans]GEL77729.1 putative transporter YwrA [Tenuibacillus multivorans]SDN51692.1 chromate transporter [Tenuibacillus multivorans]
MNLSLQKDIFVSFFRSSMLGYGGGPSTIPLVHKEVVDTYEWMTEEEFGDLLAVTNTLPGPMLTKMAGYIGFRIGGFAGMMSALIASVLPTVLIMIFLIGFLIKFRDSSIVQGMTQAITPVVGVLLLLLTVSFVKKSRNDLGWINAGILGVISIIFYAILDWHPAILIAIFILFALFKKAPKKSDGEES